MLLGKKEHYCGPPVPNKSLMHPMSGFYILELRLWHNLTDILWVFNQNNIVLMFKCSKYHYWRSWNNYWCWSWIRCREQWLRVRWQNHRRQIPIVIKYNMIINGWICAKWIVQSYNHTGILIQSGFSVVCIDLGAPQYRKPPKTSIQTHLLSPRSKNVNFDPPKGYLPLNFFQQNFIYIILGYSWVNLGTYFGHTTILKNGDFSTGPPPTKILVKIFGPQPRSVLRCS